MEIHGILQTSVEFYGIIFVRAVPQCLEHAKNEEDKDYDFYAVFADNDAEWVWYVLLPKLESELGYKGYISERDSIGGQFKVDNINNAIRKSVCVIFVITPDFFKDRLCNYCLHQSAMTSPIIPIVKEKCTGCDLSSLESIQIVEFYRHGDWQQVVNTLQNVM